MVKDVKRFDAPVIAATVKLWLLELDPPVMDYNIYHSLKVKALSDSQAKQGETSGFDAAAQEGLKRLSSSQVVVLDAIMGHLRNLIDSTQTEERNETFIKKLSLSMGRSESNG